MITDVSAPDLETRIAILLKKASAAGVDADLDTLTYIATHIERNIRELEGALIRVAAFASLQSVKIDQKLAEAVLRDLIPDASDPDITPALVMSETAAFFSVSMDDLCGSSRSRSLVIAHQIAMYLCRKLTDLCASRSVRISVVATTPPSCMPTARSRGADGRSGRSTTR